MQVTFAPDEIIALLKPSSIRGATAETLGGIAGLRTAVKGDISFLANSKYRSDVAGTQASLVLLPLDFEGQPAPDQLYLAVDNPSVALARICARLEQALWPRPAPGIHPAAVVSPEAEIHPSATVGPLCVVEAGARVGARTHLQAQVFVGRGARVGDECWLMPGTVLAAECILGNRVRLQPGAVVGADGFGYEFVGGRHEKVPQIGNAVVGDDVEIGANSTVDRARFRSTTVGEGTKIDNLVQVGHNVEIGRHCLICAQVGISGSSVLEDYVVLGGQAGLAGHLRVGKGAKVGAQSGVSKDVEPGGYIRGSPAMPYMAEQRLSVLKKRLPELFKRVDALENRPGP